MIQLDMSYYKNLLDNLYDAIYCVDSNRRIIFWNKAAEAMIGYSEAETLGKVSCVQVRMRDKAEGLVEQTLQDGKTREFDCFITRRDGRRIPVAARVNPIPGEGGRIIGAIQIFRDNSASVASRQIIGKLKTLAMLDPLTGLANRRYIEKILDSKTDELRRYGLNFGVLFIDIDHFKRVNDLYGHDTGDKVLWSVSRVMNSIIRASDIMGRWGGEEFLAVILNVTRERLEQVAEKMRHQIEQEAVQCNGARVQVTISVGGVLAGAQSAGGIDREAIIRRADELMYACKKSGRNRVSIAVLGEKGDCASSP